MSDVRDIVTAALREIGVLAGGETAASADASEGLFALNHLIDSWAAERLQIYTTTRTTWTIVSGTASYTVGTSADVNVARPVFVDHVNYLDTSQTPNREYPLISLTEDAYSLLPDKTLTSTLPTHFYYNPTFTTGTLTLWPVPTSTTLTGVLYAPTAVAEFASLSTAISLPPGYRRMLVKNLALELCSSYDREPKGSLISEAMESKAIVKRVNKRPRDMSIEAGALVQSATQNTSYDITRG